MEEELWNEYGNYSASNNGSLSKPALAHLFDVEHEIKILYGTAHHPDQGRGPR